MRKLLAFAACGALALGVAACGDDDDDGGGGSGGSSSGTSPARSRSTARAPSARSPRPRPRCSRRENPDVKITVGTSGTGGGFEKFCAGETDISDASRPIKDDEEVPICKKNGITYKEVQVANDGIAVVTNKDLKIDCLTTDAAQEALEQGLEGDRAQRDRSDAPDTKLSCSAPARTRARSTSSPTRSTVRRASRARTTSRPRTTTCSSRASTAPTGGLGYFGFSYYEQNQDKLNLVGVDEGDGCVKPSTDAIQDGSYKPLSRPLFMYPSDKALQAPGGQGVHGLRDRELPGDRGGGPDRPDDAGAGRQGQDGARAGRGGRARRWKPLGQHAQARAPSPSLGAARRRWGEELIKALLILAALISVLTTTGIVVSLLRETIVFFGDVGDRRLPLRHASGRRCSSRRASACCRS